jgi:hypothetical protein
MTELEDLERLDSKVLIPRRRSWERANTRVNWWAVLGSTLVIASSVLTVLTLKSVLAVWRHYH